MEHLTTGFVGTPLLCKALSDNGYAGLAFMLLMNKEYPSWLYPVTQGATTIWERWDGLKPDGSFQNATMNSFNHYAYGAIGQWLYQYIAGIANDPKIPGYKHFFLQPHPGGGLTTAMAELKTLYGTIKSNWKLENGKLNYACTIPPNSSATVCFDQADTKDIIINDIPLLKYGTAKISENNQNVKIELGSGNYIFVLPFRITSTTNTNDENYNSKKMDHAASDPNCRQPVSTGKTSAPVQQQHGITARYSNSRLGMGLSGRKNYGYLRQDCCIGKNHQRWQMEPEIAGNNGIWRTS